MATLSRFDPKRAPRLRSTARIARPRLPSEIIARILQAMCEPRDTGADAPPPFCPSYSSRDLRRCALVSKTFHSLATPLLFRHLQIGLRYDGDCGHIITDSEELLDQLLMRPGLGDHTLTIKLYDDRGREGDPEDRRDGGHSMRYSVVRLLTTILACCPNVRGLGLLISPPSLLPIASWLGSKHRDIDALILRSDSWEVDDSNSVLDQLPYLRVLVLRGPVTAPGGRAQRPTPIAQVSLSSLDLRSRACDALPLLLPRSSQTLRRLSIDTTGRSWRSDFNVHLFGSLVDASIIVDRLVDLQRAIDALGMCLQLERLRLELNDERTRPSDLLDVDLSHLPPSLLYLDILDVHLPFPPVFLFILLRPATTNGCLKFSKRSWTKRERRGLAEWVKLARKATKEGRSFAFM